MNLLINVNQKRYRLLTGLLVRLLNVNDNAGVITGVGVEFNKHFIGGLFATLPILTRKHTVVKILNFF